MDEWFYVNSGENNQGPASLRPFKGGILPGLMAQFAPRTAGLIT